MKFFHCGIECRDCLSPPTRGRELKYCACMQKALQARVAPYAGAGIEIVFLS